MSDKQEPSIDDYSFDQLSKLYKENPEEFNSLREQLIESELSKISDETKRNRYRAMIHNINLKASRHKNDLVRLESVASAMWESFYDLNSKLQEFSKGTISTSPTSNVYTSTDNVVSFTKKNKE